MLVIPAIDLIDGKCVRLTKGDFEGEVKEFGDPIEIAKKWKEKGAKYLHIIDLDGAKQGSLKNLNIVKKIIEETDLLIQLGGGIRTLEDIEKAFECGISRIIIGTRTIEDKQFLSEVLRRFGSEKIIIAVDVKNEKVYSKGWIKDSGITYLDYLKELEKIGCERILLTAIEKDGMMDGPDLKLISKVLENSKMKVIVAGGISKKEDVEILKNRNIDGIVIGKALYLGTIELEEVI